LGHAELDIKEEKNKERYSVYVPLEGGLTSNNDDPVLAELVETDQKWVASGHYNLQGIRSGVVKK
jgi:hypothetical protein